MNALNATTLSLVRISFFVRSSWTPIYLPACLCAFSPATTTLLTRTHRHTHNTQTHSKKAAATIYSYTHHSIKSIKSILEPLHLAQPHVHAALAPVPRRGRVDGVEHILKRDLLGPVQVRALQRHHPVAHHVAPAADLSTSIDMCWMGGGGRQGMCRSHNIMMYNPSMTTIVAVTWR